MGQILKYAPIISKAFIGAHRLFEISERKPLIESPHITKKNKEIDQHDDIDFKEIDFRYATRPDVQIMNGFNLQVSDGQTVALVGPSGRYIWRKKFDR